MPDVFNRTTDAFGGSFPADRARVIFPAIAAGQSEAGLLLQSISFNYVQQVTRLYELGSSRIYYVGGRTSGNAGAQRVIGPRLLAKAFYQKYGDVCQAATNNLTLSVSIGCDNPQPASYRCNFVVLVSIGVAITSADMMINESLQMIFSSFLVEQ